MFTGNTEVKQLTLICELLGTPSARIWPEMQALPLASKMELPSVQYNELPSRFSKLSPSPSTLDLLNALLTFDPHKRMRATQAQTHAFLREHPLPIRKENIHSLPARAFNPPPTTITSTSTNSSKRSSKSYAPSSERSKRGRIGHLAGPSALEGGNRVTGHMACSHAIEEEQAEAGEVRGSVLRIPSSASVVVASQRQC